MSVCEIVSVVSSWHSNFHPTPLQGTFGWETYVGHNILNRCHEDCKERNHSKQSLMYSFYAFLLYQIETALSRVFFGVPFPLPLCEYAQGSYSRTGDAICVSYQYISLRWLRVCYEYSYSFDPQSHYTDLYKCCQGLIWYECNLI